MKVKKQREKRVPASVFRMAGVDVSGDSAAIAASFASQFSDDSGLLIGDTLFTPKMFEVEKVSDTELVVKWVEESDEAPPAPAPAPEKSAPAPTVAKVDSADIEKAVKRVLASQRPMAAVGEPIRVKSAEEAMYDDRIATGEARFSSYLQAKAFSEFARTVIGIGDVKMGNGMKHDLCFTPAKLDELRKSAGEWYERASGRKAEVFSEAFATHGGTLVPEGFMPEVIRNVRLASPIRQLARVYPMTTEELRLPRRTAGVSGSFVNDNTPSVTSSVPRTDAASLVAKTYLIKTPVSRQILADGGAIVADFIMEEIAFQQALIEGQCAFLGDGSNTYGGMVGLQNKFTATTDGGHIVLGGASADVHTATHLGAVMGRLPAQYHKTAVWACSGSMLSNIFDRLGAASGGVTWAERKGMGYVPMYAGRPIVLCDDMNQTLDSSSAIDAYFGDFSRGCAFGNRLEMSIEMSTQEAFSSYQVVFLGVSRFDFVAHDVGTTTAAGPIVALKQQV